MEVVSCRDGEFSFVFTQKGSEHEVHEWCGILIFKQENVCISNQNFESLLDKLEDKLC